MSLVTMFLAVPPTALAPSWTPFHENSLKDLSSSCPMSVTIPTFGPAPPLPGSAPQAAATSPTASETARKRFMDPSDLPLIGRAAHGSCSQRDGAILVR